MSNDELKAILLILAIAAGLWQLTITVAGIIMARNGAKVTFGLLMGFISIALFIAWVLV